MTSANSTGSLVQAAQAEQLEDPVFLTLEVHRLVQGVVRAQMPTREYREDTAHDVHRVLVGARPRQGGTDDPENWPRYDLIWPHLSGSEAATCEELQIELRFGVGGEEKADSSTRIITALTEEQP